MLTSKFTALACLAFASGGVSSAQSPGPRDAWMMKNYNFTGPPPPGSIAPTDPVVSDLRQIQSTLFSIMRRAVFNEDYEAALAAAEQAAATTQLIGTINERLAAAAAAKAPTEDVKTNAAAPVYAIALKDHTIATAAAYWTDALMLHYMTLGGAHVQVRLDLVDRALSTKLNRMKDLEFTLPK
jgi:hypothetical protein